MRLFRVSATLRRRLIRAESTTFTSNLTILPACESPAYDAGYNTAGVHFPTALNGALGTLASFAQTTPGSGSTGLTVTKTLDSSVTQPVTPGASVTYDYTVTNTSNMAAANVVVTDDLGIPNNPNPVTVATIPVLAPGATSQVYKYTTTVPPAPPGLGTTILYTSGGLEIGTVTTSVAPSGTTAPNGASLAGDIEVVFNQSLGIVDNTYGTNASSGWGSMGHSFNDLLGSDQADFQFFSTGSTTTPVLNLVADYVSQSSTVTFGGAAGTLSYPSGYGTVGTESSGQMFDGELISGNGSDIDYIDTTITDDLNNPNFLSRGNQPLHHQLADPVR